MEDNLPFVSAIVPCRNEEKFISSCLESIVNNDYPKEKLEVLVVDGMSEDKTREIVGRYVEQRPLLRIIENPQEITPSAMNIGIKNSKGEIIIKMDAHSLYPKDYIQKCVKHLVESGAQNVGGILKTMPAKNTTVARAIAITLSHFFGAGSSWFRIGSEEPREVDTVAFGCYWKKTLEKIGLYNEKLAKIEDLELNRRLRNSGGKIMLFPDIQAIYYPSSESLKDFFRHNFTDGIWTTYHVKFASFLVSIRHLIPLGFVLGLALSFILGIFSRFFGGIFWLIIFTYSAVNIYFSFRVAVEERDLRLFFLMPLAFACRHFGYGLGSIFGIIKLITD